MKIYIDAGHGGKDPGASGHRLREKDIVLDIALRLGGIINRAGGEAHLTRSEDYYVPLEERCRMANDARADRFVSLHCDALAGEAWGIGATVYYHPESIEGKAMAESINKELDKIMASNRAKVHPKKLAVIYGTRMPAVLVECGYIDNPKEANLLARPEFRQRMALAIAKGLGYRVQEKTIEQVTEELLACHHLVNVRDKEIKELQGKLKFVEVELRASQLHCANLKTAVENLKEKIKRAREALA